MREHHYKATIEWTGNHGDGTADYRSYGRNHDIILEGKPAALPGSADPAFRGDAAGINPEEMLVASLSSCHMLWYLHLCADADIIVTAYRDEASGTMGEGGTVGGRFESATLRPRVTITDPDRASEAAELHDAAHKKCFIANSVNFPITVTPEIVTDAG